MRETVEVITLIDPEGRRVQAQRITTYESGLLMGGGETPTNFRTMLPNGTGLEGMLGDETFIDMSTGAKYTRA